MGVRIRVCVLAVLVACAMSFIGAEQCMALRGDVRYEYATNWRGVQAQIWVYNWGEEGSYVLWGPEGKHVSSVYMRFNDNHRHVECGLTKEDNWSDAYVFYQWNKNPYYGPGVPECIWGTDWYGQNVATWPATGQYVTFEINNPDMGGSGSDTWRMAYNGTTLDTEYMPFVAADAVCSSEIYYMPTNEGANTGDDGRSSFRNLRKKNNSGSWSYWVNSQVWKNDLTYYTWGSYSASHWYSQYNSNPGGSQ